MKRHGELIMVKPEKLNEYKLHHARPWKEVNAMIKECNIQNYSIFSKGDYLFAYYEYVGDNFKADMEKMEADPKTKEWWDLIKPFQIPLEDRKEGEWWASMEEVYHIE